MRDPHNITRKSIEELLSSNLINFPQFVHALAVIKRENYNNIRIPDLFSYGKKLEIKFIPDEMLFSSEVHNWITLFTKVAQTKKITWDRYYNKTITFDDFIKFFTDVKTDPIKQYFYCKYTLQLLFDPDYKKSLTEEGVEYIEKIGHIIAIINKYQEVSPNRLTQQDIAEIIADSDSSIPEIINVLYYIIAKELKLDGKFVRIIDFNAVKYLLDGSPMSGGGIQEDLNKANAKLAKLRAEVSGKTGTELDKLNKTIGYLEKNIAGLTKKLSAPAAAASPIATTPAAAASVSTDERFKLHLLALKWLLKLKLPELSKKDIESAPPNVIINDQLNPSLNMKILTLFTGQFILPKSGSLVGKLRNQRSGPSGLNALEMIQANIAERRQAETAFETGVEGYKEGLSKDAAKKFLEEAERGKLEAIIKKDKEIRDLKEQIKTIKDSTTVKGKLQENLTKQLNAAVLSQNTAEVRELLKQINPKLDEYIKKGEENKQNKGNEPQKPKEVDQNDWNALRNKARAIKMSDPDLDTKINKLKDEYHTRYPAIGYKTVRNLVEAMGKQNNNQQKKKGGSYNETLRNHFRNNRATRRRF
jgi:hypothetical protein